MTYRNRRTGNNSVYHAGLSCSNNMYTVLFTSTVQTRSTSDWPTVTFVVRFALAANRMHGAKAHRTKMRSIACITAYCTKHLVAIGNVRILRRGRIFMCSIMHYRIWHWLEKLLCYIMRLWHGGSKKRSYSELLCVTESVSD